MSLWKNSTSLILAARNGLKSNVKLEANNYDYKILSLKRHKKSSFMPGAYVFPGGMTEPADSDLRWKQLYSSFGYRDENYEVLFPQSKYRPMIFHAEKDELPREISLRITAIRETFEECGILLCKKRSQEDKVQWASHILLSDKDIKTWQNKIQSNPKDFYVLCETLECYPDLWSLYEWNAWLTPTVFRNKRFETVFFLAGINNLPQIHYQSNEIEDFKWGSPLNLLETANSVLPPPQHYELSRIVNFNKLDDLIDFAIKRSKIGIRLHLPVSSNLIDGFVLLLPGDSKYPDNVSKSERQFLDNSDMTILQFRQASKILNRIEVYIEKNKQIIVSNYKSDDGHVIPKSLLFEETQSSKLKILYFNLY